MNIKVKRLAILSVFLCILSVIFVFMVKNVDVAPVGAFERIVGLSSLNRFFYNLFGFNDFWYKITNYPGMILDFLVVGIFAVIGLKQWIERKNIFKVDKNLFVLCGTYVVSFIIYVMFEKFVINYRPIVLPNEKILEPSFPSSHTMFAIVVMGTAVIECGRLIKNAKTKRVVNVILYSVVLITIFGRTISGVHWFTDILGGIFIGSTLLSSYSLSVNIVNLKKKKVFQKYNSPMR